MSELPVRILVCTTCRAEGEPLEPRDARSGARLYAALAAGRGEDDPEVAGVECFSVCKRPCTVSFSAPGAWTYVYGDFSRRYGPPGDFRRRAALRRLAARPHPLEAAPDRAEEGRRRPPAAPGAPEMTAFAKIPATIVTGFLGAGKTTMIRHLLENAGGRRIALVINEFGDVGVDGEILKSCGVESCREDDIIELANGCICCTVADDFLPAIETLLKRADKLDHIVIETSGLALPKPLLKAFDWPEVRSRLTVDGVVAVVDAAAVADGRFADDAEALAAQRAADPSLDHDNPLEEVYEDQLLCADIVVLNKTDLLSPADAARVAAEVRGAARGATKVDRRAAKAASIPISRWG